MRWADGPMDVEYLERLVAGAQSDGHLVTRTYRYSDDPGVPADLVGRVMVWKVELRGDDVLELARLAGLAIKAGLS